MLPLASWVITPEPPTFTDIVMTAADDVAETPRDCIRASPLMRMVREAAMDVVCLLPCRHPISHGILDQPQRLGAVGSNCLKRGAGRYGTPPIVAVQLPLVFGPNVIVSRTSCR